MAEMEVRPSLFGLTSVEVIETFILGFYISSTSYENSQIDTGLDDFRYNFGKWVSKQFNCTTSQGWSKIVRFHSRTNEDSVTLFFSLLNKFKNENNY